MEPGVATNYKAANAVATITAAVALPVVLVSLSGFAADIVKAIGNLT